MLTKAQQEKYGEFYSSTHENEFLDSKTEVLVGLGYAIALNCKPCTNYYLGQAKKQNVVKGEISEVVAKVMAVSAGQKKLQTQAVLKENGIDLDSYT
ncbi:carboxymuconolactone decarboxylase family protein [Psychromonas sp. KJ10-10]|uniref:carboxymuconolactone decarboxylase family protein n=1 Tax=Psychromonas sp. KJ10-10 TaxID=3391823 RepID=UPI0039B3ED1D